MCRGWSSGSRRGRLDGFFSCRKLLDPKSGPCRKEQRRDCSSVERRAERKAGMKAGWLVYTREKLRDWMETGWVELKMGYMKDFLLGRRWG